MKKLRSSLRSARSEVKSPWWKVMSLLGYGFEAHREHGQGGFFFGLAFQYNFGSLQYAGMKAYGQLEELHADDLSR